MCLSHNLKAMQESPTRGSTCLTGRETQVCGGDTMHARVRRDSGKIVRRVFQGVIREAGRHQRATDFYDPKIMLDVAWELKGQAK